jgi:hypothetical protein
MVLQKYLTSLETEGFQSSTPFLSRVIEKRDDIQWKKAEGGRVRDCADPLGEFFFVTLFFLLAKN